MAKKTDAFQKIRDMREQKNVRAVTDSDNSDPKAFVTLARLENQNGWEERLFDHAGETWLVECKKVDIIDTITAMDNVKIPEDIQSYLDSRDALNKQNLPDEELKRSRDALWSELSIEQKTASMRAETDKANSVLLAAIRFPQETGEPVYLSNDGRDGTADINDLSSDFIECLHVVYNDVNDLEGVDEAVSRFPEVGTEE